eukprot:gene1564-32945_t
MEESPAKHPMYAPSMMETLLAAHPTIPSALVTFNVSDYAGLLEAAKMTSDMRSGADNESAVLIHITASAIVVPTNLAGQAAVFNWTVPKQDTSPDAWRLEIRGKGSGFTVIDCAHSASNVLRMLSVGHIVVTGITFTNCMGTPLVFELNNRVATSNIDTTNFTTEISTVNISDCIFSHNEVDTSAPFLSPGIAAINIHSMVITNSSFESNVCRQSGNNSQVVGCSSAIMLRNIRTVSVLDCSFYNNTHSGPDSGVLLINSTQGLALVQGSTFDSNRCSNDISYSNVDNNTDVEFMECQSTSGGVNAIRVFNLTVSSSAFINNRVDGSGSGGVYLVDADSVTVAESAFSDNMVIGAQSG